MKLADIQIEDERLSRKFRIIETDHVLKPVVVFLAHSGDSWLWFAGLIILSLVGSPSWQYLAVVMTSSFIFLAVIVLSIKFTVRRQRPAGEWGQFYRATDPNSFPSGHAARAFLLATLSLGISPGWLAITLCIWAPLVSLARVGTGLHYLSDVVAGMLIGILAGVLVLSLLPDLQPFFQFIIAVINLYIRPVFQLISA